MQIDNEFRRRLEEMLEKEFNERVQQIITCETHRHNYLKAYIAALREVGEWCKIISNQIQGG